MNNKPFWHELDFKIYLLCLLQINQMNKITITVKIKKIKGMMKLIRSGESGVGDEVVKLLVAVNVK